MPHSLELFHQPTLMHSILVESGLQSALNQYTVQTFTESEDTRCSKHVEDNSVTSILLMNKENCALKLVDEIILSTQLH